MGLIPPEEVGIHRVLKDARLGEYDEERGRWLATGSGVRSVSIEDIIDSVGPRVPAHTESQKSFRVATIIVSPEVLDGIPLP